METAHSPAAMSWFARMLVAFICAVMALLGWAFVTAELSLLWQAIVGFGAVFACAVLKRTPGTRKLIFALMAISTLTTTRYIYWRITETLPIGPEFDAFDLFFAAGLLAAELYAALILYMGFFQVLWPLKRKPVAMPSDTSVWPMVDIYIPTYNESLAVVRPTIIASLDLDWPSDKLRVYVLDDGKRPEFAEFCAKVGATHITRPDNKHAKAGNINHALGKTNGEFIAIFDSDHIPTRSFLQLTAGTLINDPKMALVQTPHHFFSADPFEKNLDTFRTTPNEGELFYGLLQDGNDYWNATFFCGSCAIMRRTALEQIGGIAVETVTEDAHTSLKMHRLGWRTAYINIRQAAGLATESLSAHVGQRIRWARGMAQIFRLDNPMLGRGLSIGQRLCYSTAMLHFFYGLPRIVFLTAPLAYLLLDARIISAQGLMILFFALPHLLCAIITNSRIQGPYRHSFFAEVYESALAFFIVIPTTVALFRPHAGTFNVTAKGGIQDRDYFDKDIAKPYLWIFLFNVLGIIVGVVRLTFFQPAIDTLLVTMGWTIFNLVMLGAALRVASERRQVRTSVRVRTAVPVALQTVNDSTRIDTTSVDLSYGGAQIAVEDTAAFRVGERIRLAVCPEVEEIWMTASVRRIGDATVSVEFTDLDMSQERQLVYALYGRADAWLHWRNTKQPDRPLRAFLQIIGFGFQGFFIFFNWILTSMRNLVFRRRSLADPASLSCLAATVGVGLMLFATSSIAQTRTAEPDQLGSRTKTLTFEQLGADNALRLRNARAEASFPITLRQDEVVTAAELDLHYAVSPGIRRDLSHLTVRMNGETVDSWRFPEDTSQNLRRRLSIDPKLFVRYNHLQFESITSYARNECEDPTHQTLWTQLEKDSTLTLRLAHLPMQPDLSHLPAPFIDNADDGSVSVPFVVPEGASHEMVEAAVVVASWLSVNADWRYTNFPVAFADLPDNGNVIAMRTGVNDIPALSHIPMPSGAEIRVLRHPGNDAHRRVLLISAPNTSALRMAAQALAYGSESMRGEVARIDNFVPPDPLPPNTAPRWVSADTHQDIVRYASGPLNATGYNSQPVAIDFRMPPHLYFRGAKGPEVDLTVRATGNTNDASRFLLNFNGKFLDSTKLATSDGKAREAHLTPAIATSSIGFGNRLEFQFAFIRETQDHCRPDLRLERGHDAMQGSLDDDIRLRFPRHAYYARLPDLGMLVEGGFPYSRQADGDKTAIVMANTPEADAIAATLTIVGFISRNTGAILSRAVVIGETAASSFSDRDFLIVGNADHIQAIGAADGNLPMTIRDGRVELARHGMLTRWMARARGRDLEEVSSVAGRVVHSAGNTLGAIVAAESPLAAGNSQIIFTAGSNGSVFDVAKILTTPGKSQFVGGDLTLLNNDEVSAYALGSSYGVGKLPIDWALMNWLDRHPWAMLVLLVGITLLFIWLVSMLLRARAERRMRGDA